MASFLGLRITGGDHVCGHPQVQRPALSPRGCAPSRERHRELLKQSPGFRGYYIFDCGNGVGGSVTLIESRDEAMAANEKVLAWIRASLSDLIDGEPEITAGEGLATIDP